MKSLILLEALRFLGMSVGTSVADWYARTGVTGYIVLATLVVPLTILMIAVLLVKPRRWNVTKLFFMLLFILYGGFGILYLSVSVITGAVVLGGYLYLFFRPSQELAWTLFKISSPQLFLLFTAAVLDVSLT